MTRTSRRTFLGCIGSGLVMGGTARAAPRAVAGHELDDLVAAIIATPRRELLGKAVEWHRAGTGWQDLLAAVFLAGIREVEPRPVGFQFHCVMMTSSAFDIALGTNEAERLAVALYNLDDFKLSQARDARGGDWRLGTFEPAGGVDSRAAVKRVERVLEARDLDDVDAACGTLARCAGLDEAFEPFWWYAMRDFTNIGHNPIFAAQAHRTMQHIGWRHGTDVMRSLGYGLLDGKAGALDATFVANQKRAAELSPRRRGNGQVSDLLAVLHEAKPEAAAAAAFEMLQEGLPLERFWDALRLMATDQVWRDPGVLAVHAVTSVNAFRYIWRRARSSRTRAMALLQAVSWQVLYRDYLSARSSYDSKLEPVERLMGKRERTSVAAAFEAAGEDRRRAARLALWATVGGTEQAEQSIRHWLLRKVREHHDYKFAAALIEEMRASTVASTMFAASLGYLRKPADGDHALWQHVAKR